MSISETMVFEGLINTVIHADNISVCKDIPKNIIDLTVTSPPYDNMRDYEGGQFDFEKLAMELFRITKQGGVVVWISADQVVNGGKSGTSFRQVLFFISCGFILHDTIIYEKNGSGYPDKKRYFNVFEYMFIFSKGSPKTVNLIKDRKNEWFGKKWSNVRSRRNKKGELKVTRWEGVQGEPYGVRFNIWHYKNGYGYSAKEECSYEHPAIFPEELAADHIRSWSNPGELIFDPFAGSFTTAKMAKLLGRNFIACDISEKYCKIGEKRLRQEVLL